MCAVKLLVLTRVYNLEIKFLPKCQFLPKCHISIENPLYRQSEKACMCFKTRWASTRDYTVIEIIGVFVDTLHTVSSANYPAHYST